MLSGDSRGRREGRKFSTQEQDTWNVNRKKGKKLERSVEYLWAGKRINPVLMQGGVPWEWEESSVTQSIDMWGVVLF